MIPIEAEPAFRLSRSLLGVALTLSSLEFLSLAKDLHGSGPWAPIHERTPRPWLWSAVMLVRLLAGLALLVSSPPSLAFFAALAAFASTWAIHLRMRHGLEGADQMQMLLSAGVALAMAARSPQVTKAFLGFAAVLAIAAYGTGGLMKAFMPGWRDGSTLAAILRSAQFGHPLFARIVTPGRRARLASWLVVAFESSFPFAVLLGPDPALCFCAAAFLFHCSCAVAMGLNVFPWAFAATYPAVVFWAAELPRLWR